MENGEQRLGNESETSMSSADLPKDLEPSRVEAGVSETGHPTRCTGQTDDKMGTSTCRLLEGGATEKDDELLLIGDLSAYHGDWESVPSNNPSYFVAAIVSFGSLAVGYGLGFTSPAAHQLQAGNGTDPRTHGEHLSFEADDISWFGSILFLAGLVGGAFGGPVAEYLGRRTSMILSNLPFIVGWIMIAEAENLGRLLAGRALVGFGLGVAILLNPVYLAETVLPALRGALSTVLQLSVALGFVISFALGISMSYKHMAIVGAGIGGMYTLMLFAIPETPRWYLRHCQPKKGEKAMRRLRGAKASIYAEFAVIRSSVTMEQGAKPFSLTELREPWLYRPFLMSLTLMLFQQWSGVNAVVSYTTIIFDGAGLASKDTLISMGVVLVQLLFTFISIFFVDRYGRRPLLMAAGLGMCLSCATMSAFFFCSDHIHGTLAVVMPILAIYIYMASFSLGLGIIPWLFMPEVFPSRTLSLLSSLSASLNWLSAFIVTHYFADLGSLLGNGGVFALLAAVCFLLIMFSKFVLVETKGRSLEEMETIFRSGTSSPRNAVDLSSVGRLENYRGQPVIM